MNIITFPILTFVIFFALLFKTMLKSAKVNRSSSEILDSIIATSITSMVLTIVTVILSSTIILNQYLELVQHKYNLVAIKSKDFDKSTISSGIFVSTYEKEGTRYYTMFMETADGIKNVMYEMDDDRVYIKESNNAFIEEYWLYHRYPKWVQKFYFSSELRINSTVSRPHKVVIYVPKGSIVREFNISL